MAVKRMYKQMTSPDRDEGQVRSFDEVWLIDLDNPRTSQIEIENYQGYPYQYQTHPQRQGFYAVLRHLDQNIETPNVRKLNVTWSTRITDVFLVDGQPKYPLTPTARPARVTWGTYRTSIAVVNCYSRKLNTNNPFTPAGYNNDSGGNDVDKNGNITLPLYPPINTAGELIFLQDQTDFRVIQFRKNVQQLPTFMSKSGQYLNSDTVRIRGVVFKPYSLLAADIIVSDWEFENGIPYFVASWNFYVDEVNFWYSKKRNVGFNEKVAKYQDKDGNEVTLPVPGGKKYYVLRPIVVGPVDNRHYPSQPVLLRASGTALRTFTTGDNKDDPESWSGEIMTTESKDEDLRDQAQKDSDWQNSELWFRNKPAIPFNKFFPMQ